ncbi:MAG: YdcF family protein [Actinomycetota bacterium]|nr:YdcF family protein [Actinomycetota bacterium]
MKVFRIVVLALVALLAYPAWLGFQIWDQSLSDENRSVDAIVVLGAAQYDGEPSPIYEARLRHANYLFEEGFSDTVVVTGGKQEGDRFTEAEAGESYLINKGVPAERILLETEGRTTLASLEAVSAMASAQGIDTVLLVSDPMHSERIKRIAYDLGFKDAWTSPASYLELNRSRATKFKELVREIASLLAYELTGGA